MNTARITMDDFWHKMRAIYGRATWDRQFPLEQCADLWEYALANYSRPQVMSAIAEAVRNYPSRPPTLPQFRDLCKAAPDPTAPLLPAPVEPTATKEEQRQWVQDLKDLADTLQRRGELTQEQRQLHMQELGLDDETQQKLSAGYVPPGSPAACAYSGCARPGALSQSITGSERFYCREHFRPGG